MAERYWFDWSWAFAVASCVWFPTCSVHCPAEFVVLVVVVLEFVGVISMVMPGRGVCVVLSKHITMRVVVFVSLVCCLFGGAGVGS